MTDSKQLTFSKNGGGLTISVCETGVIPTEDHTDRNQRIPCRMQYGVTMTLVVCDLGSL